VGREAGAVVVADEEGWKAVTAVGAVVVAGGEGWEAETAVDVGREAGAVVVDGGEGWEAADELRAVQARLCVGQCAL
jgi:hypothetical protein